MKYRLAYFRPDDAGGQQDVDTGDQHQDAQLPEGLVKFLSNRNLAIDPADPKSVAIATALYKQSAENARDAEKQRKRAQEAEGKLSKVNLDSIIDNLDDESKQKVSALITATQNNEKLEASLKLLAEHNVTLSPELFDLAKAGPEATKAYLATQKAAGTNGQSASGSLDDQIKQAMARMLGVGADEQQKTQDQQTKVDPLARWRPKESPTAQTLATMQQAATQASKRS